MQLPDRAKHRLRIAAGLLRNQGYVFNSPRDEFYSEIQTFIEKMVPTDRERLRELTDWVETFDNASKSSIGDGI